MREWKCHPSPLLPLYDAEVISLVGIRPRDLAFAAACVAVVVALAAVPTWAVVSLMALMGFLTGLVGPSRDLLVRRAATTGIAHSASSIPGSMSASRRPPWFSGRSWTRAGTRGLAIFTAARVGAKSRRAATV